MGDLKETKINGLYIIEPEVFKDEKGSFIETYSKKQFLKAGINMTFVQEIELEVKKGILRGLNFNKNQNASNLIKVVQGEVFIVAVDLRYKSTTLGKWESVILNEENKKQFYIPNGFAHGFLSLSDKAIINYKRTNFYIEEELNGIVWNDPDINIKWPLERVEKLLLNDKEKLYPQFKDLKLKKYPQVYNNNLYYC